MKNIIWLASYPRSGNTWIRILLSNYLSGSDQPVSINDLVGSPIASSRSLIEEYMGYSSYDLRPEEYDVLRPEVYKAMAEKRGGVIFTKVHDAYRTLKNEKLLFPPECSKGIIYLIRHPFDVCRSLAAYSGHDNPRKAMENMCNSDHAVADSNTYVFNQTRQVLTDWSGHVCSWVDQQFIPVLVVRYEDMLNSSEATFKEVIRFLGLNYNEDRLKMAIDFSNKKRLMEQEEEVGFDAKPYEAESFFSGADKKKLRLTENQKRRLYDQHQQVMDRFNYTL